MRRVLVFFTGMLCLASCDGLGPVAQSDAQASASGDVLYRLAPLALGETFSVALGAAERALGLHSTRHRAGYALSFVPDGLDPDSVVVRYLFDGREAAPAVTYAGGAAYEAGESEEGPDSWHYVWINGDWVLTKDYRQDGSGEGPASTAFTTSAGQRVAVTDVVFEVYGIDMAPPDTVRFATPRGITVTYQSFSRPQTVVD